MPSKIDELILRLQMQSIMSTKDDSENTRVEFKQSLLELMEEQKPKYEHKHARETDKYLGIEEYFQNITNCINEDNNGKS